MSGVNKTWWRPRRRDWWMAVLFVIGAACFTFGGIVTQWSAVSRPAIGYVFFVGSIFFTTAAALQFAESLATHRRIDWVSSLIQLIGTILFNISTFAALRHNLTTHQQNARVWAPDAFGSIAFLVSSAMAFYGVRNRWWCFDWRSRDWNVAGAQSPGLDRVRCIRGRLARRAVDGGTRQRAHRKLWHLHRRDLLPGRRSDPDSGG